MKLQAHLNAFKRFKTLTETERADLLKDLQRVNLLTEDLSSAKLAKNINVSSVKAYILYLSPERTAYNFIGAVGNFCPKASAGCAAACLNTAGRGRFSAVQNARLRKSLYFIFFRQEFMQHLEREITKLSKKYKRLAIRLNGTSDLPWYAYTLSNGQNIFERFERVQFYDYTKVFKYLSKLETYKNWHLTFSASETNIAEQNTALAMGVNVAKVYQQLPVGPAYINGDAHDLRFLDGYQGKIIALKAKGKAKNDAFGFAA